MNSFGSKKIILYEVNFCVITSLRKIKNQSERKKN